MSKRPQDPSDSGNGVRPMNKGSKKHKVSSHEIQLARETAELFKSNIFKLQIDQLIQELKLKPSHCLVIEKVLHKLHSIILEIPASGELDLKDTSKVLDGVKIPFPEPVPSQLNYPLQYTPPQDINLVGSFGLKSAIKQKNGISIDVALSMDKSLFSPKDYLNYRVLYKKSFYLAYLAAKLKKMAPEFNLPIDISFDFHNGDKLCPSLIISSLDAKSEDELSFKQTNFSIRLLASTPFGFFDAKKILPDRNCIRIQDNEVETLPPTPLYNASVLSSSTYVHYLKYLYTTKRSTEAFKDAASLAKLWLNQRGLSSHIEKGGFGHFEFSMLMAALLEGGGEKGNKILLHGYSSYQLFKGTIKYLATQDLSQSGYLSFNSIINEGKSIYKDVGFDTPTVFDKNTKINLLWKMSNSSYKMLKYFASQTLDSLNDLVNDKFNQIFILNNSNPIIKFDYTFTIPFADLIENLQDEFTPISKVSFITIENFIKSKIELILTNALGDRVSEIDIHLINSNDSFNLNKRKPSNKDMILFIGLMVDSTESEMKLTKGPNHSDESEGEKFSSFWGDIAQLRRYKDGSVQWSCLWDDNDNVNVSPIITIIKYILDRHLNFKVSKLLKFNSIKFNEILPKPVDSNNSLVLPNQSLKLAESFNNLVKILQKLNLPIGIKSVLPISTNLRSTSVILPIPFALNSPDFWNDCIIHFDNSSNGKWPQEIIALEDTKTAMLLKIKTMLPNMKTFIVDDDSIIPYNSNIKCLRILTNDGFGFQFRVILDFEENLYLKMIESADVNQKKIMETIYFHFYRHSIGSIKHHRSISTFINQFPMLSSSIRLFKIWLDKQFLLCHLSNEVIELIVLKVFIDSNPYGLPNSPMSGFLRVMKFISEWNWIDDPLILDMSRDFKSVQGGVDSLDKFNGKFTISQNKSIIQNFNKIRNLDPKGVKLPWFIVSRDDMSGKMWTFDIDMLIANRLTSLAKLVINELGKLPSNLEISSNLLSNIFTSSLNDFNIVIQLKENIDLNELKKKSGVLPSNIKFKNLIQPPGKFPNGEFVIAGADSDPYFNFFLDLKARFEGIIWNIEQFNHLTKFGQKSRVITGLIKPGNLNKKFRVGMGWSMKLDKDNETVSFDLEDVLKSVSLLGGDLIENIVTN